MNNDDYNNSNVPSEFIIILEVSTIVNDIERILHDSLSTYYASPLDRLTIAKGTYFLINNILQRAFTNVGMIDITILNTYSDNDSIVNAITNHTSYDRIFSVYVDSIVNQLKCSNIGSKMYDRILAAYLITNKSLIINFTYE